MSTLIMNVGRSAPRFENLALLYPRSRDLRISLDEYFIVVVRLCHDILKFTRKTTLEKVGSSLSDSNLKKYRADLDSWGNAIKDEVRILLATQVRDEARMNHQFREISTKFFKATSKQHSSNAQWRILDFCSEFDHLTTWKQIRKAGNTSLFSHCHDYLMWRQRPDSNTLIYSGKLGAGKSVMLANMVDDLCLWARDTAVAFFFSRHDISESLKAETIIGSIARQLLSRSFNSTMEAAILEQCEMVEKSTHLDRFTKILHLLKLSNSTGERAFVLIDGFDELEETERDTLLRHLSRLQQALTLSICITLRHDPNIPLKIEPSMGTTITPMPDNTYEIETFVAQELMRCVESRKLVVHDITLLSDIRNALQTDSQGMFLWAALQIESLCSMETDNAIRLALENLPKGLPETFERILQRSEKTGSSPSYQRPILELLSVAQRPLTVDELREALSVLPGDTNWDPSRLLNNIMKVLACCGSLVCIDEEELTLRLVHHSVKQYLLGGLVQTQNDRIWNGNHSIAEKSAHDRMSGIIITYLNYSVFDRQLVRGGVPDIKAGQVLNQAIHFSEFSSKATNLALKFLRDHGTSDFNMAGVLAEANRLRFKSENQFKFRDYANAHWSFHVARSLPFEMILDDLFRKLCRQGRVSPIITDEDATLLLLRAVQTGYDDAIKHVLSSSNVSVNSPLDRKGRTALHLATMGSFKGSVLCLLQSDNINVAARDVDMKTPLVLAFERRNLPVVQPYLDFQSVSNKTNPLIIELLPQAVQVLDAQDSQFALKILHSAVINDDEALVGIFASSPVNITSNPEVWSIIHAAAIRGNRTIIQLMFDPVRTPCLDDNTKLMYDPLHLVAEAGDEYLTKFFLDSGKINAKSRDGRGQTPLHRITKRYSGRSEHMFIKHFLLLEAPEAANQKDLRGQTPLHIATMNGDLGTVRLLLHYGAHPRLADDQACIPLHYAVQNGYLDVVRSLICFDEISVNRRNSQRRTPLHIATIKGLVGIVSEILNVPTVEIEASDLEHRTPLSYAIELRHASIAKLLYDFGAKRPRVPDLRMFE